MRRDLEYRLILTSELSGKDAAAVAAHVRLFVDVPFTFETDGTEAAEIFVKLLRSHLADGKRRNCPLYPSRTPAQLRFNRACPKQTWSSIPVHASQRRPTRSW